MVYCLEVAVDSVESAIAAKKGGATRLELSQNLILGGTTPSVELFRLVKRNVDLPINVVIRPRCGDFYYSSYEFEQMLMEIKKFKSEGAYGVSVGVLEKNGSLDMKRLEKLMQSAGDMRFMLNRAFDFSNNPFETFENARMLGIKSILTSGQMNTALEGMPLLKVLNDNSYGIEITAAGMIDVSSIGLLLEHTSLKSFRIFGRTTLESAMHFRNLDIHLATEGISEYQLHIVDENKIAKASEILAAHIAKVTEKE